jgi:alpha-1,6-mannosyltransferase
MSVSGPLGATSRGGALDLTAPGLEAPRASTQDRKGLFALGGLLLAGLLISISAAQTDSLLPESVRPVPSWLAGPFGTGGPDLHVAGVCAVLVLMLISYVIAVHAADRLSARVVLMTIAGLHALVLLAPPLLSTDVFSYQAYARMGALYGANPFIQGPHAIALDPVYPYIGAKWVSTPSAYGPVFTVISYLLAPASIAASALAYKAIAAVASLAIIALVWNAARLRGLNPVKAAALVGLNPLLVVYGVGGGHNDLLMLLAVTAGVYAMLIHRERSAGALVMLGAGIKLTAAMYVPFAAAAERRNRARNTRRDVLTGALAGAALVTVLGFSVFGSGPLHLLGTLRKGQSEGDWHSIPGFISTRLGLAPAGAIAGMVLAIVFVGAFCWLLRRVWQGRMDWIDGAGWATVALLVTASALLPWYVAWLMPFAALASDRRLWKTALIVTCVVQGIQMLGYIPHGSSLLGL